MFTKISKLKKFILKRNLNNSGFTLLELLVAIAIFSLVVLGSSWFYSCFEIMMQLFGNN